MMKVVSLGLVWPSAILAIVFATAVRAEDKDTATVSKQAVEAKMKYCEVCHGPSAQGFVGYYPIPRLAGQQPEYIKNQLQAFIDRGRVNPIMANVAHVQSPAMQTALATKFSELNPKLLEGGPKDHAADRASIVAALERQLAKGDKALVGNTGYRRYLKTISDDHFAIDLDKIEEDKKFDGVFVLRTNTDLNPLEAMLCYSNCGRWSRPSAPPSTSSPPDQSSTKLDETIRGHVFCSFRTGAEESA